MNWQATSKSLPAPNKLVLTFSKVYGYVIGCVDEHGEWGSEHGDYETGEPWLRDAHVSHWMKLPKKPDEQS